MKRVYGFLWEKELASGMTAPHRLKDLADVQEIIKIKDLPAAFAKELDPFVREKFLELQQAVDASMDRKKMKIYHIVLPETWEKLGDDDFYEAASLESEGFIHCSFAEQLDSVLTRYYSTVENVVIIEIETDKLTAELIEEASTNDEIYPHIYGRINRDAIVGQKQKAVKVFNKNAG